jgi:dynein heavy chain 1, cytosolic
MNTETPENFIPEFIYRDSDEANLIKNSMYKLLIIKTFRPDRFTKSAEFYINTVFESKEFLDQIEKQPDLLKIINTEIKSTMPVIICSKTGFDASSQIEDLAIENKKRLISIAIGSKEGFLQADESIKNASKSGDWILLKNVHLAPNWLIELEKKFHNILAHHDFRLFLSTEIQPKLPINLIKLGRCFVFEPQPGIIANMSRTLNYIPFQRMNKTPNERSKLYFILAWFHAIIQERLRYVPLGWSKQYEFNESDFKYALDIIDKWIDLVAYGRNNLPPNKIPFNTIRTLMSDCVYGSKIDNLFDKNILNNFLKRFFSQESFESDFKLIIDDSVEIDMPDDLKYDTFLTWSNSLKQRQTSIWFGLAIDGENFILTNYLNEIFDKMKILTDSNENEQYESIKNFQHLHLNDNIIEWINMLSKYSISNLNSCNSSIKNPMIRFYEREVSLGIKLLKTVLNDLENILNVLKGDKIQTNFYIKLIEKLVKNEIPTEWNKFKVPNTLNLKQWIINLAQRLDQVLLINEKLSQNDEFLKKFSLWFGGLFSPEAFISATHQYVARLKSWPLEELVLKINIYKNESLLDECSFCIKDLILQGAELKFNKVFITSKLQNQSDDYIISWVRKVPNNEHTIQLPVYLNKTRNELIFTVNLPSDQNESLFYMRGVAFIAS